MKLNYVASYGGRCICRFVFSGTLCRVHLWGGFRFRRHLACGSVSPVIRKLRLSGVTRISGSIRLKEMNFITTIPEIDKTEFIQQFDLRVIQPVKQNPEMLYKKYWIDKYSRIIR